jgi:hypothetical protein
MSIEDARTVYARTSQVPSREEQDLINAFRYATPHGMPVPTVQQARQWARAVRNMGAILADIQINVQRVAA